MIRTRTAAAAGMVALLALTASVAWRPTAAPAPERLSSAEFWRLSTEMSEPGGYFRSDNFISNEGELQYVLSDLQRVVPPGRAYVGVGPEQNLTYIASLEPSIAFIVDIRRQNLVQHLFFKALMELSDDRAAYLSRMLARPRPDSLARDATVTELMFAYAKVPADSMLYRRTFDEVLERLTVTHGFAMTPEDVESLRYISSAFAVAGTGITYSFGTTGNTRFGGWMPTLAEIMVETDEAGTERSYLASDSLYQRVRGMHQRNLIVPVVGNFGGDKALRVVATWLREHDTTLGVFYASNVEQYLFQQGDAAARFYDNLGTFKTDSASTFVRSATGRGLVMLRNPRSRMAQFTMPVEPMLRAIRGGLVASYGELVMLRP